MKRTKKDSANLVVEMGMFRDFPDVLSVKDVQQALQIGRAGVYKLLSSGAIGNFKIGNTYKIPKDCLIAFMNQQCRRDGEWR